PFTLGAVTGYVFNRTAPQGAGATAQVVSLSLVLLAGAMLLFALEGLVCVALALPLALVLAILGGVFGRVIALHTPGRPSQLAGLVLAVPLLAGADPGLSPGRGGARPGAGGVTAAPANAPVARCAAA